MDLDSFYDILKNSKQENVTPDFFRNLLIVCNKFKNCPIEDRSKFTKFVENSLPVIEDYLSAGYQCFDTQLLCSSCYFTLVTFAIENDNSGSLSKVYLQFQTFKNEEIERGAKFGNNDNSKYIISLIYGILNSNIFHVHTNKIIKQVLNEIFNILIEFCYTYGHLTYISFKLLHQLMLKFTKKIDYIEEVHLLSALQMTSHNWENPITGVRVLNRKIFGTFLQLCQYERFKNITLYNNVVNTVICMPWNKAKYLMLAEIIANEDDIFDFMSRNNSLINGLLQSLKSPSLVSAGNDMYVAIISNLKNEIQWKEIFLEKIVIMFQQCHLGVLVNFSNYWLAYTFKIHPLVVDILKQSCAEIYNGEIKLYAMISIVRHGNKLGLIKNYWEIDSLFSEHKVRQGLEHSNVAIRITYFEVICTPHNMDFPFHDAFSLVLKFIEDNINSDSTPLRQKMLDCANTLFHRIQNSSVSILRTKRDAHKTEKTILLQFFSKLQNFLIMSLTLNGNYQRVVTSLRLADIVLNYCNPQSITKDDKKKGLHRKSNLGQKTVHLLKGYLKENNFWILDSVNFVSLLVRFLSDPTDDIRDISFNILMKNFKSHDSIKLRMHSLITNGMSQCNSKFFYEVEGGSAIIKLTVNILVNGNINNLKYKNNVEFLESLLSDISMQYCAQQRDVLQAIHDEKPLYGLLSCLNILLCTSNSNDDTLNKFLARPKVLMNIIDRITSIVNFYLTKLSLKMDTDGDFSHPPSFSEMGESIKHIVDSSEFSGHKIGETEKLSDLHQIVLNCIWLNLKVCCDIAYILIVSSNDAYEIKECLSIIISVLKRCRHKGAIEAAGVALGKAVKHLTSSAKRDDWRAIPMSVLISFLEEMTSVSQVGGSVTRRSAGLGIMLHRLVTSDGEPTKPLFHYTMRTLIGACQEFKDSAVNEFEIAQRDIPKAKVLHLLCHIVSDSSLASDTMHYASELVEICFDNLTSVQWQIRNAALQLYGSLVPKLIGQKKAQGGEQESAATVTFNELCTHIPNLWTYINKRLQCSVRDQSLLETHSNLVPVLSLVSSTSKRFTISIETQFDYETLFQSLRCLLDSPIYTVRELAARAIEVLYDFDYFLSGIKQSKTVSSENSLHGHLMVIRNYLQRNSCVGNFKSVLEEIFPNIKTNKTSYLVKSLIYDIEKDEIVNCDCISTVRIVLQEYEMNKRHVGIGVWANNLVKDAVLKCTDEELPTIVGDLLSHMDGSNFIHYIDMRFQRGFDSHNPKLINSILEVKTIFSKTYMFRILFNLLTLYETDIKIPNKYVESFLADHITDEILEDYKFSYGYMLPLVIKLYTLCDMQKCTIHDLERFEKVSKLVLSLSDPEYYDVRLRMISAVCVNSFALQLMECKNITIKCNILTAAINLLQDEDYYVRHEASKFINFVGRTSCHNVHAYVCLKSILKRDFLLSLFGNNEAILSEYISNSIAQFKQRCTDRTNAQISNPFESPVSNIYLEPQDFIKLLKSVAS